jgi:hypothetical protein
MAIVYHAGQIEVQEEANSRPAATMLAERMGSRSDRNLAFYARADLVIFATADGNGVLRFGAMSGQPGLLTALDERSLALPGAMALLTPGTQVGAIAIDLEGGSRARVNGVVEARDGGKALVSREEFINCRKYIAPSVALEAREHSGPESRDAVAADDAGLRRALAAVETAFVATVDPTGQPDVSHKGGPPGFLNYDPSARSLEWIELIGNGFFRSAGNVRATGSIAVIALDLASGDAYELTGSARYTTRLRYATPRERALWPAEEDFPVQGVMKMQIEQVSWLRRLIAPRRRLANVDKITSCSPVEDQVPR